MSEEIIHGGDRHWRPGDLVMLKSGGATMTVNEGCENSATGEVWCYFWSNLEGKIVLLPVHRDALVAVKP